MAGQISPLGEKLLTMGTKKVMNLTTMDWGLGAPTKSSENLSNSERPYVTNPGFMRPHTSMMINTSPQRFNEQNNGLFAKNMRRENEGTTQICTLNSLNMKLPLTRPSFPHSIATSSSQTPQKLRPFFM